MDQLDNNEDDQTVLASERRAKVMAFFKANEGKEYGRKDVATQALGHNELTAAILLNTSRTLNELAGAGQLNSRIVGTSKWYSVGEIGITGEQAAAKRGRPFGSGTPILVRLLEQQKAIEARIEEVMAAERNAEIERIRQSIAVYGLKREELFPKRGHGSSAAAGEAPVVNDGIEHRRRFTDEEKIKLVAQHAQLVKGGMTHNDACTEVGVVGSVMRNWYRKFPPKRQRKAA